MKLSKIILVGLLSVQVFAQTKIKNPTLDKDPTQPMQAATKQYVDNHVFGPANLVALTPTSLGAVKGSGSSLICTDVNTLLTGFNIDGSIKCDPTSFQIGSVSTLPQGSQVTVTNTGTGRNVILNFGIPQGADATVTTTGVAGNFDVSGNLTPTRLNGLNLRGQVLNTFGDSITNGQGASSLATQFTTLIGAVNGWTINNPAVRGDMLFDQCKYIYGATPTAPATALTAITNSTLSTFLIGQNDAGNAINNQDAWASAYLACAAWLLTPNKITGQSSLATRTGTFTNSDLYPAFGTQTITSGDVYTASVYGSAVYLWTQTTTSCTNSFSVSIDSVPMGSFSQKTPFTTTHSTAIAPQLLRFGNLQNSTHRIDVTNNSSLCKLYIDAVASPQGQLSLNGPFLFAATPYQTQVPATTDMIASMIKTAISTLAEDGLGAILTDLESFCGTTNPPTVTTNLCNGADTTHPNDQGEIVIANAFLNDMSLLNGYASRQVPNWLRNILLSTNQNSAEMDLIEACSGIRGGIACDTFDRVDTTSGLGTSTSGSVWTPQVGVLGISGHKAYGTIGGNNWSTISAGSGDASESVQLSVLPLAGGSSQLWIPFRVQDNANYWRLGLPSGSHTLTLQKIVAGSPSGSQPTFNTVATNDIIKIVTSGSLLSFYVNGKLRGTFTDATYSTATGFGFQMNDTATRVGYFALSTPSKSIIGQKPLSFNSTLDSLAVPILMQAGTTADQTDVLRWADHTGAIKYNLGMFNDGSFQLVDPTGISRMLMLSSGNRQILPTGGLWSVHDHAGTARVLIDEAGSISFSLANTFNGKLHGTWTANRDFAFPDASGTIPLLERTQNWTGINTVPVPTVANQTENHANALNNSDWQTIESAISRQNQSQFSVTAVTKAWNFNSILPAGTGTASLGYGNIWLPNNAVFRIAGCPASQWVQRGGTFNDNLYWNCAHALSKGKANIEFLVYSDYFDFALRGDGSTFRVVIDGRPASLYDQTITVVDSTPAQYHVQLDGNPHRVSIECMKCGVAGIITPNGAGSADLAAPDWGGGRPVVVAMGNSHTWGQTSTSANPLITTTPVGGITFVQRTCDFLNWNCDIVGVPGTDYVNTGGGVGNYGAHITTDVCVANPKLVWWSSGGWNDIATASSVQAAALADFQAVAACSSAPIQIVTGPFQPFASSTGIVAVDTAIKAAVVQAQGLGVVIQYLASPIDELWVTGNNATCNLLNTTGNACELGAGSDGVHFPQSFHDYAGVKFALRIHQNLPQLGAPAFDYSTPIQASTSQTLVSRHTMQQKTGTVSATTGSATLTGVGTLFTKELRPGWNVMINPTGGGCGITNPMTIASITSDTSLTLTAAWSGTCTNQTGVPYQLGMSPLPESWGVDGAGNLNANNIIGAVGTKANGFCPVVGVDNVTVTWTVCAPSSVETAVFLPTISLSASSSGAISIIPPFDMTVTDISLLVSTAASGCTGAPIWTLNDNTIGTSAVITVTFTNGSTTTALAQTGQSYTLTAGHLFTIKTTAGTGCTTAPVISGGTMFMKRAGT